VSFAKLKGQEAAVSFLKAALKNNKLSHAYIFCGPSGVGKTLAAMNFAKAIICPNTVSYDSSAGSGERPEAFEGCDNCPSCKKVDNLMHPDVFMLKPEKEGVAIRTHRPLGPSTLRQAQGRPEQSRGIKIDDVRKLIKDIYLRPFEAKKKVYIIDEAQHMKHEAANALLKTLEEPPTDSILILIVDNLKALFHTIVSRSQVVRFYPLKSDQIKELLIKEHGMDEAAAHVLSRLSCGSLGEAARYKGEDMFEKRSSLINNVAKGSLAEFFFDDAPKEKMKFYLDILLTWFRDILAAKAGADNSMLVNIDKIGYISGEANRLSFKYLEDVIGDIILTLSYLDQNVNMKLAMSILSLNINEKLKTKN